MAAMVSGNYFTVLGAAPAQGRTFVPDDDAAGGLPVVLVSDNFWERRFERDPGLLGRRLTLNGVAVAVVGITPRNFNGTLISVPDFWVPLRLQSRMAPRDDFVSDAATTCCRVYGRLRTGFSLTGAEAQLDTLAGGALPSSAGARRSAGRTDRFVLAHVSAAGAPRYPDDHVMGMCCCSAPSGWCW
jgi:hypothetical protein